jgi:hypothetical protein
MDDIQKPLYKLNKKDLKKHKLSIQKRTARISILGKEKGSDDKNIKHEIENMDKEALIDVIQHFLIKQPGLIRDVMTYIPEPTISSAMNVLIEMEKKFIHSFPFNKHGPGRDDYTFSRVREPLLNLIVSNYSFIIVYSYYKKDTLIQYTNHFTSTQVFPTTCFTFLDYATHIAHRLPTWDNEGNDDDDTTRQTD